MAVACAHRQSLPELVGWWNRPGVLLWSKILLVSALALVLYSAVLLRLALAWWEDPGASHGFLIPPLALYIAWVRRDVTFRRSAAPDDRAAAPASRLS